MEDDVARGEERLESLERGLRALALFGQDGAHALTMIEVAERMDITRAAARRILFTLEELGFLRVTGRHYSLTPRVLTLGYAYLSSLGFRTVAKPLLDALVEQTGETCSIGVLDQTDVVYVLRSEAKRLVRIDLNIGSRLPAYVNSMGRVLLSALPDGELDAYLKSLAPQKLTRATVTDKAKLKSLILQVRKQGWCHIENESEEGISGLATAIREPDGRIIAALNMSLAFSRRTSKEIREQLLPQLLGKTEELNQLIRTELRPD